MLQIFIHENERKRKITVLRKGVLASSYDSGNGTKKENRANSERGMRDSSVRERM